MLARSLVESNSGGHTPVLEGLLQLGTISKPLGQGQHLKGIQVTREVRGEWGKT